MKKIRLIALTLALIMILSSCSIVDKILGKTEEPPATEGDPAEIDLTTHIISVSRYFSDMMDANVTEFQFAIQQTIGKKLATVVDNYRKEQENTDPEILLGPGSRKESAEALKALGTKSGWVIARINNKIVINGTSDYMIAEGMKYFLANCLKGEKLSEGVLTMATDYSHKKEISTLYVAGGNGTNNLSVVYSDKLDRDGTSRYGTTSTTGNDYLYDQALLFATELETATGKKAGTITAISDKTAAASGTLEILFGSTTREGTTKMKEQVAATQYGVYCTTSSVSLFGWTNSTVMAAKNHFLGLFDYCKEYESKNIKFPLGVALTATTDTFAADIPEFTEGKLNAAEDSGSGTIKTDTASGTLLQYYPDVPKLDFEGYCSKLEKAGYSIYEERNITNTDTSRVNYYKTYKNDTNMVHIYYIATSGTKGDVKLVSAKLENINLPNATEETYTKRTEPMVTQMRLAYTKGNFGMCYIITLEDGSFVIFDGGGDKEASVQYNDDVRLHGILTQLHTEIFGKAPSVDEPITIAAWFLTHQHFDHVASFQAFCRNFCTGDNANVKIEQFVCNLASKAYAQNSHNPSSNINTIIKLSNNAKHPFAIVEVHTGQVMYIRNVMVEILYTQEDLFPLPLEYFNNTSIVTRFSMRRSTGTGSNGMNYVPNPETVIFLGDQHLQGDRQMRTMYGDDKKATAFLKSDVLQVAHHGWNGCTWSLYDVIDADILLWPAKYSAFTSVTNGKPAYAWDGVATIDYKAFNTKLKAGQAEGRWVILVADYVNYTVKFPFVTVADKGNEEAWIDAGVVDKTMIPAGDDYIQ